MILLARASLTPPRLYIGMKISFYHQKLAKKLILLKIAIFWPFLGPYNSMILLTRANLTLVNLYKGLKMSFD